MWGGEALEWRAAIYGRVSTEHEEQQESIKVQKAALMEYAKEKCIKIEGYYFDEGYSGTNFERPELARLKSDIDRGIINMVITKDLSRIGRNNTLTLLFLDYLCEKNVRLVALNDDYDTLKDEDDLIGIKTWVNERYSRELSRKIKFALKHKKRGGEYLTAFAPYGYKKSAITRNKLEVDYYASQVVREIFRLYIEGNGFSRIAEILEDRGVLNPSRYGFYGRRSEKWNWTTIKRIITNPVYTGDSVQQRYCKKTYKSKSITRMPESEWIEVKNTHEPIITRETFDLAMEILNKRKKKIHYRNGRSEPHLFSSFLYCHECGSSLYYKKDKNSKGIYRCGRYVKYGRKCCSSHTVSEEELINIVYEKLISIISENVDFESIYADTSHFIIQNKLCSLERKISLIEENIRKNNIKLETIYRDKLNGVIDEALYIKMKCELEGLLREQTKQREGIIIKLNKIRRRDGKNKLKEKIKNVLYMEKSIDRQILERFVKRIEVSENNGIIIVFNFIL